MPIEALKNDCSNSYDSHSNEQLDCGSDESEQKLSNEVPLPDPFSQLEEVFLFAYEYVQIFSF